MFTSGALSPFAAAGSPLAFVTCSQLTFAGLIPMNVLCPNAESPNSSPCWIMTQPAASMTSSFSSPSTASHSHFFTSRLLVTRLCVSPSPVQMSYAVS